MTIITATHDLHIIEDIADEVYIFGQDRRVAGTRPPCGNCGGRPAPAGQQPDPQALSPRVLNLHT